jgi:hypothetical protein
MAVHRFRLTVECNSPITAELMEIWREDALRWEGVVSAKVTDASLSDEDLDRLRGQAATARGQATPPWSKR